MSPMLRLRPTARPVRRAAGEVQFGLSPERGIVLAGLTDPETELLLSLAATSGTARDVSLAHRFGVPLERVDELVTALRGHGLLVDPAAPLPPRDQHALCVAGRGSVADRLREELGSTGSGHLVEPAADPEPGSVELALLCARDAIAPDEGRTWQSALIPHLPVVLRDGEVIIGPLVTPGRSACLRCLDLHRRDRDQAWPRILTQLTSPTAELTQVVDAPPSQAAVIAALVAMIALESLNTVTAPGISWQVSLPCPQVSTRVWEQHPHCHCSPKG